MWFWRYARVVPWDLLISCERMVRLGGPRTPHLSLFLDKSVFDAYSRFSCSTIMIDRYVWRYSVGEFA